MKTPLYYMRGRGLVRLRPGKDQAEFERKHPQLLFIPEDMVPTMEELEEDLHEGVTSAVDGCAPVEHDGHCQHGYPSWFLAKKLI